MYLAASSNDEHFLFSAGGFRPVLDGPPGTRNTPPLFFPPHLASHISSQFSPPLFPALKGMHNLHCTVLSMKNKETGVHISNRMINSI